MATYQSVGTSTTIVQVDTSFTVTKPSGVAVGDLLVAGVFGGANNVSDIAAPGGWTELDQVQLSSGSTAVRGEMYYRVATAADVSAVDYIFTVTDGTTSGEYGGIIVRVSDWGGIAGNEAEGASITGASAITSSTITGFTPTRANCLFIAFTAMSAQLSSGPYDMTGVSFATSNPTWTARAAIELDQTNDTHRFECFTAVRPEATATGTITYTFASSSESTRNFCMVAAISPQVNGSITPATEVNAYAISPISPTRINAIVDEPTDTVSHPTQWTNTSKGNTTWTNETKP